MTRMLTFHPNKKPMARWSPGFLQQRNTAEQCAGRTDQLVEPWTSIAAFPDKKQRHGNDEHNKDDIF